MSASDGQSGLADADTYKYYLNSSLKQTTTEKSYTFIGLTGGTKYTIKVEAVDKAGRTGSDTKEATTTVPSIPETETQVANYADVDGNGSVDGVIYADLAIGGSGTGLVQRYTITKGSNFKKYRVTQESYSGSLGTGKIIAPVSGNSGNERFYVMALSDVDSKTHYWYYSAYGNMNESSSARPTSEEFGRGEQNTINMINKWNSSAYGSQNSNDMWGISAVNSRTWNGSSGWYIPSRDEWAAFAGELDIDDSNYSIKGLSDRYWSSSQNSIGIAWDADFNSGGFGYGYGYGSNHYVRLGTTF